MRTIGIFVLVLFAACTDSPPPEPRESVIGAPLHQALDRAEAVQETLDEHAERMRSQLESAENGD